MPWLQADHEVYFDRIWASSTARRSRRRRLVRALAPARHPAQRDHLPAHGDRDDLPPAHLPHRLLRHELRLARRPHRLAASLLAAGVGLMTGPFLLVLALVRGGDGDRLQQFGRRVFRSQVSSTASRPRSERPGNPEGQVQAEAVAPAAARPTRWRRRRVGPERLGDLVERRLLVAGDPLAADAQEAARLVGLGGVLGDGDRELAVVVELLRGRLRLDQRDRLADPLEAPGAHVLLAGELLRVQVGADCTSSPTRSPVAVLSWASAYILAIAKLSRIVPPRCGGDTISPAIAGPSAIFSTPRH